MQVANHANIGVRPGTIRLRISLARSLVPMTRQASRVSRSCDTAAIAGALSTACGVAAGAMLPLGSPVTSKIVWGIVHALAGVALVWYGGFRLFEKLMAASIAVMFVSGSSDPVRLHHAGAEHQQHECAENAESARTPDVRTE